MWDVQQNMLARPDEEVFIYDSDRIKLAEKAKVIEEKSMWDLLIIIFKQVRILTSYEEVYIRQYDDSTWKLNIDDPYKSNLPEKEKLLLRHPCHICG